MQDKFEIINFIDNCRWDKSVKSNYGLINYSRSDLPNDLKLLTHWISYITDRQMKFEIIWDVGGFVFSDMLYNYKQLYNGMEVLNPKYKNSNFISTQNGEYTFISNSIVTDNPTKSGKELLNKYEFKDDNRVTFVSRFYPADYVSMFYTMHTLKEFNKDFITYIIRALECMGDTSPKSLIKAFAYSLYILTYEDIGQPSKKDLDYNELIRKAKTRTNRIIKLLNDEELLSKEIENFYKNGVQYKIKRIWCCIRDYIKSDEFGSKCLKTELAKRNISRTVIRNLFSNEARAVVELPGDVWNNNSTFRNCLLKDIKLTDKERKMSFNKLLRLKYEEYGIKVGYPEQFDVTFDFVPRMCEKNNCDICPFNISDKKNSIEKICVNNKNKYCTVAQICCNYQCMCKPNDCAILKKINKKR
ncbi:MAG: hypothetical protein IKN65_00550 [Clostridia bacterium]|nr:hypothetical protein [Clostridia bacterium]